MANSSGPTHSIITLSQAQAIEGHEVHLFYVSIDGVESKEPDSRLVKSMCFSCDPVFGYFGFSLDFCKTLTRNVNLYDIVHIHAVWNFVTYYSMKIAYKNNIPYIVAPHGSFNKWALHHHYYKKYFWIKYLEKPLLHKCSAIHALTKTEANEVNEFGIESPVFVCQNALSAQSNYIYKNNYTNSSDVCTFLFLSRIHPKKGLDILAEALNKLNNESSKWRLIIAGDDSGTGYLKQVKKMFLDAGVLDRCNFLGDVRGEAKIKAFTDADVFVLPSYSEGLPISVLEAMSYNLPVIITSTCNLPEVSSSKAGIVVNPNSRELYDSFMLLINDSFLRKQMGYSAKKLVETTFNPSIISKKCLNQYISIINKY